MVCVCAFTTPHSITFISATNLTLDAFATNPVNLAFRQRDIKKGVTTIVLFNFGTVIFLLQYSIQKMRGYWFQNQQYYPKKVEKYKI